VIRSEQGGKTETAAMAQWMIGESYFHQENYEAALREYLRVEILFDYPRWAAASLVQAAKCHEHLGEWKDAAELYTRLLNTYPDCELAEEARERLEAAQARTASKRRS
jgi:TolA-binding protein